MKSLLPIYILYPVHALYWNPPKKIQIFLKIPWFSYIRILFRRISLIYSSNSTLTLSTSSTIFCPRPQKTGWFDRQYPTQRTRDNHESWRITTRIKESHGIQKKEYSYMLLSSFHTKCFALCPHVKLVLVVKKVISLLLGFI